MVVAQARRQQARAGAGDQLVAPLKSISAKMRASPLASGVRSAVVRISLGDLKAFTRQPAPLPAPVEPRVPLVEEFVLLSLGAERHRVRSVARMAAEAYPSGPSSEEEAMSMLEERGLVAREAGSPAATDLARLAERLARVRAIIRRPAVPVGGDAELVALLAAARSLPLENADDRLSARVRLASLGTGPDLPPAVAALVRKMRAATIDELADRLLAAEREDLKNANFDPGTSGAW